VAGNSLKKAPRRDVTRVERIGDWGEVTYAHHLSCGHVEVRKRQSPAPSIACSGCLTAIDFAAGNIPGNAVRPVGGSEPFVDDFASVEAKAARVRAGLAKRFGLDSEQVDVAVDMSDITYALVFLDRDTAIRLSTALDNGSKP